MRSQHLEVLVLLVFVSGAHVCAVPEFGRLAKGHAGIKSSLNTDNGAEQVIFGVKLKHDTLNGQTRTFLLNKLDQQFDQIIQEMVQADQREEDYEVNIQDDDLHSMDTDKQLKSLLLIKMKQMYNKAMMQTHTYQQLREKIPIKNDRHKTEAGELMDQFLFHKINEIQAQGYGEPAFDHYDKDATISEHRVQIMSDEHSYLPIFRFDGSASEYCYPDWPSSQNDGRCVTSLNQNAPVFYQVNTCDGQMVYTYWLWYGLQRPCITPFDEGHGDDWEHVSVYVNPGISNGQVSKVVFHQHSGHYTRRRGEYQSEGERPIVYIGKVAHGSYHVRCDGRCSFTEFIRYGCYGSVKFCPGGCGYWDDFRNPGPELRDGQLHPLMEGQVIEGIERPNRAVCGINTCDGSGSRSLFESGCWQDKP